jgi:threonine dehydratase
MATPRALPTIDPAAIQRARAAGAGIVKRTPVLSSLTLSERCGGTVAVKAENLQRTGSFKLRGALSKLDALGSDCARGVTAGSAGNHAQSLARAARERGVPCEVFMPTEAPIAKAEAATALGAVVHLGGESVDECVGLARARAEEAGMVFVHPFDDAYVVAGQATLGLELVEDVEDLERVVVPVGGGGLASGLAIAVKSARPDVQVYGVRAADRAGVTIADGIAVKSPGELTGPLLERWLDGMVEVGEEETAEAMVLMLERSKLVVEGAGAVGVAALLSGAVPPAPTGTTVAVLSGGNVDAGLLATIARRQETEAGRRLALMTRVPDRPGALAKLLACVAETGANLVEVSHVREGVELHVRETAVELVLETRGSGHAQRVLEALEAAGYGTSVKR